MIITFLRMYTLISISNVCIFVFDVQRFVIIYLFLYVPYQFLKITCMDSVNTILYFATGDIYAQINCI